VCALYTVLVLVVLAAIGVTVDAAVKSAHYTSIGCHTYADRGGEMERCQGLYTLERTWDEAAATCETDGWTGLALADTHQVETALGQFMMLKNDEIDADNGYRAWIGGREVDDRVWKWSDGTTFQRQSDHFIILHLLTYLIQVYLATISILCLHIIYFRCIMLITVWFVLYSDERIKG